MFEIIGFVVLAIAVILMLIMVSVIGGYLKDTKEMSNTIRHGMNALLNDAQHIGKEYEILNARWSDLHDMMKIMSEQYDTIKDQADTISASYELSNDITKKIINHYKELDEKYETLKDLVDLRYSEQYEQFTNMKTELVLLNKTSPKYYYPTDEASVPGC